MPSFALADTRGEWLFFLVCLCLLVVGASLWSTSLALMDTWRHEGFQHGYAVPFISGFLLWRSRLELASCEVESQFTGALALSAAVLLWLVAWQTLVQLAEQIAFIGVMICAVWALFGREFVKRAAFPLGFLFFAVPVGSEFVSVLMDVTANGATALLKTLGMSIYREGYLLMLPAGNFEIAEACSGFKYLYSGIAISVLIAYTQLQDTKLRLLFIALSAVFFVFLNSVRAVIVILVASLSDMTLFVGRDHVTFGWVLFAGAIVLQIWVANYLARKFDA